jgi:PAS domain S-box-containing protein
VNAAGLEKINVFCVDGPPADYLMSRAGIRSEFKKTYIVNTGQFHRAVKKGNKALLELLVEGDARIAPTEKKRLEEVWLAPREEWSLPLRTLGWWLLALLALSSVGLVWVWMLRKTVVERTGQLERERRLLQTLIQTIPDLVWMKDATGVYRVCNPATRRFFKDLKGSPVGKTDYDLFPIEIAESFRKADQEVLSKGRVEGIQEALLDPVTGQEVHLETTKVAMRDAKGDLIGVLGVARDVTAQTLEREERERLEEKVRQAQKLESLGVLSGGIAHDFNNLLTSMLGNADLAKDKVLSGIDVQDNLRDIETAARRAAELCRQLLAYSGKGQIQVHPLDLQKVVQEMGHLLSVSISKNVVLRYEFAPGLPLIDADASQVRQVVMNLITNASEAIGEKEGVILVKTGLQDCDEGFLETTIGRGELRPGQYVVLEVTDTGCGMAPQELQKVFDPFYTTKFTGRGLGLAAVLGIMSGHQGGVKVKSEAGKGTSFKLIFPPSLVGRVDAPIETRVSMWKGNGKVLLVDDEATIREVGRQMLERAGLTVFVASDGLAALELFHAVHDIDCVVLDLTMPRMDGEACFREMRRLNPKVKVVLCSGYNESEVVNRFVGEGLAGFLQKPYVTSDLLGKVQEVFERRSNDKAG